MPSPRVGIVVRALLFALSGALVTPLLPPAAAQGQLPLKSRTVIAYVAPSRDSQQIRLIYPDGSDDRLLWQVPVATERSHGIGELGWRSDAGELAFDSGHDWQRSLYLRDIYAVSSDGTRVRRLTRPPAADDAGTYPAGDVTFWFSSYASGDVQLYIEGADRPIFFSAQVGYFYQIEQTVPDLGEDVRQYIRLYAPYHLNDNWCNYNDVAWVDVVAGRMTDAGRISFGVADDFTCPQTLRPAWMHDRNELLYLFAEASVVTFQEDNDIWRLSGDAPPATNGTRVLDYGQYLLEGRVFLALPGRNPETADQLLVAVRQSPGVSNVFRAPLADAGRREFIDWGSCTLLCDIAGMAWLPDGSGFVFSLYADTFGVSGNLEKLGAIYRYTFADQQVTEIYRVANQAIGRLDVSPDGRQIVFEQSSQFDETADNYWLEPLLLCPCQLWIIGSDGTNARRLSSDGRAPAWSPVPLPQLSPRSGMRSPSPPSTVPAGKRRGRGSLVPRVIVAFRPGVTPAASAPDRSSSRRSPAGP